MTSSEEMIRELRLQLRRAKPSDDINSLLRKIEQLGNVAAPLIPEIIAALDRGLYPVDFVLVPIIAQHKSRPLLEAFKRQLGSSIGISAKATLFRAGFSEFQGDLIEYLRDSFDRFDPPVLDVLEAVEASGTKSLVQDLEDIESWASRRLRELQKDEPDLTVEEQVSRKLDIGCLNGLLKKLRPAIQKAQNRPDLTPPPYLTEKTVETGGEAGGADDPAAYIPGIHAVKNPELARLNFHPEVARHAQELLVAGNYFHAVFEAVKAYDKAVRIRAKSSKHGTALMFEAFSLKGPIKITPCITETDKNIQEGTMHLSVGLIRAVRDVTAHEPVADWPMSREDALTLLGLVSFLFRQLELDKATDPKRGLT
jgi:uncharacterized protein (TIGR02391 family)